MSPTFHELKTPTIMPAITTKAIMNASTWLDTM